MKLSELKQHIDFLIEHGYKHDDPEIRVIISTSGSIGGTPTVGIKSITSGFDWDSGKIMISTLDPIMKVNQNTLENLRKEAEKIGYSMSENRSLKAEVKRLRAKVKDLTPE